LFLFIPFAALFLFEVLARRRLHVVQYVLVGLANCLFYLLLLALAEHLPFLAAYLVSAAAVCGVTTFYVGAFLPDKRQAALAFAVLALQYGYLFCALSSEDYALLIGSVGLFGITALTMAATRKVDWFGGKGEAVPEPDGEPQDLPEFPPLREP
ncbi:MAG TPA: inner membrane CreD family protein, partial [Spirochaetia bacterium]|nr:inner membrane CreD family protein [Spirochaetia bacterium]